jgi:hypothetical protein
VSNTPQRVQHRSQRAANQGVGFGRMGSVRPHTTKPTPKLTIMASSTEAATWLKDISVALVFRLAPSAQIRGCHVTPQRAPA